MSKNLIFFIKTASKTSSGSFLLEIEPITFENSEIKEILIRDTKGLQKWVNTLPDSKGSLSIVLTKKVIFLEIKIDNFSLLENGRLKVEDWIESKNIAIPKLNNVREFSVYLQPKMNFFGSYGALGRQNREDSKKWDLEVGELVDFYSPDFAYPIKKITFEGCDSECKDKVIKLTGTIPRENNNPKKTAVKITVKKISSQNSLSFASYWWNGPIPGLKLGGIKVENIEISAPFSRVENPTNPPPQKPVQENEESEEETGNDEPQENTNNDNEKNKPTTPEPSKKPKPNQKPTEPGKDKPDSNEPVRKTPEKLNEEIEAEINQQTSQKATNIDNSLKKASTAENIEEKLSALMETDENLGDQSYQNRQEEIYSLKREIAEENIWKYCQNVIKILKTWMNLNEVNETDLEVEIKSDYEKLENNQIKEASQVIQTEQKIIQKVGEVGARKRFENLVNQMKTALKSKTEEKVRKSIQNLARFVKSSNVFDQIFYSENKPEIENYRTQLENLESNSNSTNSVNFPWQYIIPLALGIVVACIVAIIYHRKKRLN